MWLVMKSLYDKDTVFNLTFLASFGLCFSHLESHKSQKSFENTKITNCALIENRELPISFDESGSRVEHQRCDYTV